MNSVGPLFRPSLETWPSPVAKAAQAGPATQGTVCAPAMLTTHRAPGAGVVASGSPGNPVNGGRWRELKWTKGVTPNTVGEDGAHPGCDSTWRRRRAQRGGVLHGGGAPVGGGRLRWSLQQRSGGERMMRGRIKEIWGTGGAHR
jgi:hypothetical protein